MLKRCTVNELADLFSRHPKTVQRDLRYMESCPYFDVRDYRPLGGGKGANWSCAPEVYEVFRKYNRLFKADKTGQGLPSIKVMTGEEDIKTRTQGRIYKSRVRSEAEDFFTRTEEGRQIQTELAKYRAEMDRAGD